MEKIPCLLCGDPSATIKMSKRGQPYLRCENCESILFTYSELGAEMLKAGGVGLVENAKAEPVRPELLAHGNANLADVIAELKAQKATIAGLRKTVEAKAEPKAPARRKAPPRKERGSAADFLFGEA